MDIASVQEFIKPELLILIPVLYFIGMGLKKAAWLSDNHIPLALGVCGILLSTLWVVATEPIAGVQGIALAIFTAIVQGVLVSGCSVYADQIKKQETIKG